jgi:hypothetical protein
MNLQTILVGLLPSIGALLIFFLAVRGVIRADRKERAEIAREEAEEAARGTGHVGPSRGSDDPRADSDKGDRA